MGEVIVNRVRMVIAASMVAVGVYFVFVVPVMGQSQETLNERFTQGLAAHDLAIKALIETKANERLAVLEDTVYEVKWVGRTVAGALLVQLMLQASEFQRRRKQ